MTSLKGSLVEMLDWSAHKALIDGESAAGRQALARMTLLLFLIDRLDDDEPGWEEYGLLPESFPWPGEGVPADLLPRC